MRIAFFLFFLSLSVKAAIPQKMKSLQLVQDCTILDIQGKVLKVLPGKMCLFFDDGRFISANEKGIKLYNNRKEVIWNLPGHYHHQLALSKDKKKILALSSAIINEPSKKVRQDTFLIISLDGKILHSQDSRTLLSLNNQNSVGWSNSPWLSEETGTNSEISHFNSFYEIPKNDNKNPAFKEGNFIINGLSHGLYIVSPDLQKILFHRILKTSVDHFVHDVQVTDRGNIIYFNNFTSAGTTDNTYSTIQEYDLTSDKVIFEFKADPESMFFSRYCGSVQELDNDSLLFSDKFNGTWIYSRKEKKLLSTIRGTHFQNKIPVFNQTTKAFDLNKFLNAQTR